MSEYWVSTPKYWCKHCSTFVVDTPLSKKNHDATGKHQGALKRFLRDLHRSNERSQHATENAKREVARLNALVSGTGSSSSTSSTAPAPSVGKPEAKAGERWGAATRPLTAAEQKAQLAELAALGVAMPEAFRGDLALPGEWTTVAVEQVKHKSEKEKVREELAELVQKEKEEGERKRRWEEMDADEKALKGFRIETRTYPAEARGGDDDGVVPPKMKFEFKKKVKREEPEEEKKEEALVKTEDGEVAQVKVADTEANVKTEADAAAPTTSDTTPPSTSAPAIKQEDLPSPTLDAPAMGAEDAAAIKTEDSEDAAPPPAVDAGVVFKKRKAKPMRKK
ncbi:hypothetical protein EDC01DRAFT_668083 [Geopyxis carbonaria]|nr:hypothetical protein EDC01DRAFT_668083 [Geopyxis carbonaria]